MRRLVEYFLTFIFVLIFASYPDDTYCEDLVLFDSHLHYNQSDRNYLSPDRVLDILNRAGIYGALVSSIPDKDTLLLYKMASDRIVPFLRPYRTLQDKNTWYNDPEIKKYIDEQIQVGLYRGIGEIDLPSEYVEASVVKHLIMLSTMHGYFIQIDADKEVIDKLFKIYPSIKILWAHGGRHCPEILRTYLHRFPNLNIELAGRKDISNRDQIESEWRNLFNDYPDRFMVGTGSQPIRTLKKFIRLIFEPNMFITLFTRPRSIWIRAKWESIIDESRDIRGWLSQLPSETANQIAYKNAENLFNLKTTIEN